MSDDGPAPAAGAPAQGGGGGGNATAGTTSADTPHVNGNNSTNGSQRPLTKAHFEPEEHDVGTPLSRKMSSNSIDLEDYFVGVSQHDLPKTSDLTPIGWPKGY